ncbi:MAG: hypothetical protein ACHQAX_05045 [Gammaproteobacteria bacterium]
MIQSLIGWFWPNAYDDKLWKAMLAQNITDIQDAMDHGANLYAKNKEGLTILSEAVMSCPEEIVKFMVDHPSFKFNSMTVDAIIDALMIDQPSMLPILLEKHTEQSVSVDCRLYKDHTAYMIAVRNKFKDAAELLLRHGASIRPYEEFLALLPVPSDEIPNIVEQSQKIAPEYITKPVELKLKAFLTKATELNCINRPQIEVGLRYLDMFYKDFPIEWLAKHKKEEQCLLRCVLAFMLAVKGPRGEDVPYNNKSFHMMYLWAGGDTLNYATSLKNFNAEECKLVLEVYKKGELHF